jgi:hypothetical protein
MALKGLRCKSEIIRYEGLFVSQCMRRLLTPDGTVGPSTCVFPNPAELTVRDDVGVGGGRFGARPLAYVPNRMISFNMAYSTATMMNP